MQKKKMCRIYCKRNILLYAVCQTLEVRHTKQSNTSLISYSGLAFTYLFVQPASIFVNKHHHSILTNSLLFTLTFHNRFPIPRLIQYNISPFNAVLLKLSLSRDVTPEPEVGITFTKSPTFPLHSHKRNLHQFMCQERGC